MRSEISKINPRETISPEDTLAMAVGIRIVVMKDGLIQQVGSPLERYDKPANRYAGEFIGSETYVDLNTGSFRLIAAVGRKSRVKSHSAIVLDPIMENLYLFEKESGEALC